MDVESLQKSERRRGGCLDVFLVVSIICLFGAVTAVAVTGTMAVMDLRSKVGLRSAEAQVSKLTAGTPSPAYKLQNFAYLRANWSELKNATMHWDLVHYKNGISVGSNFVFDSDQQSLQPLQEGTYFMYMYLNLTCTYKCSAGLLTMHVGDKLTCEVELPELANSTAVSRKCWTVSRVDSQGLVTQMTVSKMEMQNWKLELNSSGFGMFLVD